MAKGRSFGRRFLFWASLLLWAFFFGVLVIAFTPVTGYLLKPLAMKEEIRHGDAIVVLGGGVNKGRYLTQESSHRLVRGVQLYHEGKAEKIIFSGGLSQKGGVAEGAVLAQEARRMQIPTENILIEKNSRRTHEQAVETKKITDPLRWKSVILVTSYTHMKRAVLCFEQAGFKVYPTPADPVERYAAGPLERIDLFGKILHEYGGMIYYRIKGWI
ncbi:MAG: YdcF family protein [Deltaproteobacteria bacterium]|nr:MAG: YdcF family protein [Deltaproteobacteria bacterium]